MVALDLTGPKVDISPVLQEVLDKSDQYMELENAFKVKLAKLQAEYTAKQQPSLDARTKALQVGEGPGTPAVPGFWCQVLQNHVQFGEEIYEWDCPVLQYIKDIRTVNLPDDTERNEAGFKVIVEFSENPYFENKELVRVYETEKYDHTNEIDCSGVKMEEEIKWKAGKNVTIEMKKPKGKNKKAKEQHRPSFFRTYFRTIDVEDSENMTDLVEMMWNEMEYDPNEADEDDVRTMWEEAMDTISDRAYELGLQFRDNVIPFAARFYTGDVFPDMEDGSDEEVDEDADEDEDESEEDENDE